MKKLPKLPSVFVSAILAALPMAALAQQSQFAENFAATSEICVEENAGAGNRAACFQSLLPLLSEMRAATSGPQYDSEIAAVALAMVNAYTSLSAPVPPVCTVVADALDEVGQSAVDINQAEQIFTIASSIRGCDGLGGGIERLLASPN